MRLHVRDYRAIKSADIDLSRGVATIAAPNEQGKTSVAQAARACLLREPLLVEPADGEKMLKKTAADLVHAGAEAASATLTLGGEEKPPAVRVHWPSCKVDTRGAERAPQASRIAAGAVKFDELKPQERAAALLELLNPQPARADFDRLAMGAPEKMRDAVWSAIATHGWDACHSRAVEKLQEGRREFLLATGGQTWGVDVGASWTPADWDPELEALDRAKLEDAVAQAKQRRSEVGARATFEREAVEELRRIAGGLEVSETALVAAQEALQAKVAERDRLEKVKDELPRPIAQPYDCPHCKKPVAFDDKGETLVDASEWDQAKEAAKAQARIDLDESIRVARFDVLAAERKVEDAKRAIESAKRAKASLDAMPPEQAQADIDAAATKADEAVATAEARLKARDQFFAAREAHKKMVAGVAIAEALAPTGARAEAMKTAIAELNEWMAGVSEEIGIAPVALLAGEPFSISCGDYRFLLLSESAKFRAEIVIQLAFAVRDGSAMVVIDNDVDFDHRFYLPIYKVLTRLRIPALVCLRVNTPKGSPRLHDMTAEEHGAEGTSYFLRDGVALLVDAELQQQAA